MADDDPYNCIANQDGRVVKALDLRSNGHMSAWVRTPLLVEAILNRTQRGFLTTEKIIPITVTNSWVSDHREQMTGGSAGFHCSNSLQQSDVCVSPHCLKQSALMSFVNPRHPLPAAFMISWFSFYNPWTLSLSATNSNLLKLNFTKLSLFNNVFKNLSLLFKMNKNYTICNKYPLQNT